MDERHEIIDFSEKMPVKVFIHKLGSVSKHWHESMELLFVLSGEVRVIVDDQSFELKSTDVILINSNSLHELYASRCEMVALQMNLRKIGLFKDIEDAMFECCSAKATDSTRFDNLRFYIAKLIKANEKGEDLFLSFAILSLLMDELVVHFRAESKNTPDTKKHLDRLQKIIRYTNDNFSKGISLKDIAEYMHFSVPYLSRFFKKHMRMSFSDYFNAIRLDHAVNDLISSDEPISMIAIINGFSDARSFVNQFKKRYNMLPSDYRAKYQSSINKSNNGNGVNYLAISSSTALSNLAKYLKLDSEVNSGRYFHKNVTTKAVEVGTIDIAKKGRRLTNNYRTFCCVGSARELLFGEVQKMLARLQREVGFKYVKFHGLLSDDMMVYSEAADGSPVLSFTLVDKVIDFLLGVGLKPLIQLSFMPKKLASIRDKTSFFVEYNTSPPYSMEKWIYLVKSITFHFIERYGREEVLSWPFSVWNEPDTSVNMFGFEKKEDFFDFYRKTYQAVKEVDERIIFGSPSLLMLPDDPFQWYHAFFEYCKSNKCLPEFLNVHYYEDNFDSAELREIKVSYKNVLNKNEDALSCFLDHIHICLDSYHLGDVPVYITEWNLTVNHRNLINDTCYKASYLAKSILENYDRADSFGYWSLTDLISEQQPSDHLYHGGLGLFTVNGIPKAHYNTYRLMTKLGDELLSSGKGWFVTRSENGNRIQVMLYNYIHYNDLFAKGEIYDMSLDDRYTIFACNDPVCFSLNLQGLSSGKYLIRESYVNRDAGSSFDAWVRMGAMPITTKEEFETLLSNSVPCMYTHKEVVDNQSLSLSVKLEPHEVRLVEIIPTS